MLPRPHPVLNHTTEDACLDRIKCSPRPIAILPGPSTMVRHTKGSSFEDDFESFETSVLTLRQSIDGPPGSVHGGPPTMRGRRIHGLLR
jgi:hypothetical protein